MWFISLIIMCILEIIWSIISYPFYKPKQPIITSNNPIELQIFQPLWWARGKFIQSSLQSFLGYTNKIPYRNEKITLLDSTIISLDYKETEYLTDDSPILFICHGLGGSSDSIFIKQLTDLLPSYRSIIYNRRGHGDSSLNNKLPKHVDLDDLEEVLSYINEKYQNAPKIAFGISAGANLLICYAGQKNRYPFKQIISISNGFCLTKCSKYISWIFDNLLTQSLKSIYQLNVPKLNKIKSIRKLDTELIVPLYNYNNIDDYYEDCSSYKYLETLSTPLFSISSFDDPIIPECAHYYPIEAAKKNKNITAIITYEGGHLGWVDQINSSWCINMIVKFLSK